MEPGYLFSPVTLNTKRLRKDQASVKTDNIPEPGETFFITMPTPDPAPGNSFTLLIIPGTRQPFTTSHTLPGKIGLDIPF